MKLFHLYASFLLLLFAGCGECGRHVKLGDYYLESESILDFFPYSEIKSLTFKNSEGKTLTCQLAEKEEDMIYNVHREICYESDFDKTNEYFNGEYLFARYEGSAEGIKYSLSISLQVSHIYYGQEIPELRLRDFATYSLDFRSDSKYMDGGVYIFTISYRGNPVPSENPDDEPVLLESIELNGSTYEEVWYYDQTDIPGLYVQERKGIIAFEGINEEIWSLQ